MGKVGTPQAWGGGKSKKGKKASKPPTRNFNGADRDKRGKQRKEGARCAGQLKTSIKKTWKGGGKETIWGGKGGEILLKREGRSQSGVPSK